MGKLNKVGKMLIKWAPYLADKRENVGEEERKPANKENNQNNDQGLGSVDVVSEWLVPEAVRW